MLLRVGIFICLFIRWWWWLRKFIVLIFSFFVWIWLDWIVCVCYKVGNFVWVKIFPEYFFLFILRDLHSWELNVVIVVVGFFVVLIIVRLNFKFKGDAAGASLATLLLLTAPQVRRLLLSTESFFASRNREPRTAGEGI